MNKINMSIIRKHAKKIAKMALKLNGAYNLCLFPDGDIRLLSLVTGMFGNKEDIFSCKEDYINIVNYFNIVCIDCALLLDKSDARCANVVKQPPEEQAIMIIAYRQGWEIDMEN